MGKQIVAPENLGLFLAQFLNQPGYEDLFSAARTAAAIGYKWVQLPPNCFDIQTAAKSKTYCEDLRSQLLEIGVDVSEVSFHLDGQLVAVHPAYREMFAGFMPKGAPTSLMNMHNVGANGCRNVIDASANFELEAAVGFTGSLAFPFMYPWPQRPEGLVEEAFAELAARWAPILLYAFEKNVKLAFELHPGEDVHDGTTLLRFYDALIAAGVPRDVVEMILRVNYDPSHFILQHLDYLKFLEEFGDWVEAYHAKDAELLPSGRQGVYGGYAGWGDRVGKFRSPGRGQVDFQAIEDSGRISPKIKRIVEWEDPNQDADQGARHTFVYLTTGTLPDEVVKPPAKAFDDFAGTGVDLIVVRQILGLDQFTVRPVCAA